jgi:hypothetical protein
MLVSLKGIQISMKYFNVRFNVSSETHVCQLLLGEQPLQDIAIDIYSIKFVCGIHQFINMALEDECHSFEELATVKEHFNKTSALVDLKLCVNVLTQRPELVSFILYRLFFQTNVLY